MQLYSCAPGQVLTVEKKHIKSKGPALRYSNFAEHLQSILIPTDSVCVGEGDKLHIDRKPVSELVGRFGSPLYVVAEETIRANFRRIKSAFDENWPKPVNIMYAIKANTNPAVRAILHAEGAGGDCFGEGELHATFLGGADPNKIAMNGSNKSERELVAAIKRGVFINVDAFEEIRQIDEICSNLNLRARINIRLKVVPDDVDRFGSDYSAVPKGRLPEFFMSKKWGFSLEAAIRVVEMARACEHVDLIGLSAHSGRFNSSPEALAKYAAKLGMMVRGIEDATGFWPQILDIGGGWSRERDPESRSYKLNEHRIESLAGAVCQRLLEELVNARGEVPALWVEPGRYIIGNAVILVMQVGTIKRDLDQVWVHVDGSTNNLMRIETNASAYHCIAATGMSRPCEEEVQLVGPTCVNSRFAAAWWTPKLKKGDLVAVLDAGMYAESASTQFNSLPRPATVLICGEAVDVIREREGIDALFSLCHIPPRLKAADGSI